MLQQRIEAKWIDAFAQDGEVCMAARLEADSEEGVRGAGALAVCAKDDVAHHYLVF